LIISFYCSEDEEVRMDTQGNWKELAAQKEREWKEVTELR
jgi:hypothetical protein